MTPQIEEMRTRVKCCIQDTGDGWGDRNSLRNHLMCTKYRMDELDKLASEIEALPENHSLRDAFREVNMLRGLLRERKELADARRQALEYLEA